MQRRSTYKVNINRYQIIYHIRWGLKTKTPSPKRTKRAGELSRGAEEHRGRKGRPEAAGGAAPGHFARTAACAGPSPCLPLGALLEWVRRIIRVSTAMEEASASSEAPPAASGPEAAPPGPPPAPSPLSGGYLLIVLGEPHCEEHKEIILQRLAKGEFYFLRVYFGFFAFLSVCQCMKDAGTSCVHRTGCDSFWRAHSRRAICI